MLVFFSDYSSQRIISQDPQADIPAPLESTFHTPSAVARCPRGVSISGWREKYRGGGLYEAFQGGGVNGKCKYERTS